MGNGVTTGRALAAPAGTSARASAAHAPAATSSSQSSARAGTFSCRTGTISSRHLFHLLDNALYIAKPAAVPAKLSLGLDPAAPSTQTTGPSTKATGTPASSGAGEASIARGPMNVAPTALGTGHLRTRTADSMGHLELMSTIVAPEATHWQHLLTRNVISLMMSWLAA